MVLFHLVEVFQIRASRSHCWPDAVPGSVSLSSLTTLSCPVGPTPPLDTHVLSGVPQPGPWLSNRVMSLPNTVPDILATPASTISVRVLFLKIISFRFPFTPQLPNGPKQRACHPEGFGFNEVASIYL